jgi:hypothetical protein
MRKCRRCISAVYLSCICSATVQPALLTRHLAADC